VKLTIGGILREAVSQLAKLPHAEPRLEAQLLLMEAMSISRETLIAWPEREVDPANLDCFQDLLKRRLAGEPMAYIRGRQAFWSLELKVTPDTLIPRPETEVLVESALELLQVHEPLTIADAGAGSGAIAAALASERHKWTLIAIERSAGAAHVASCNLSRWAPHNTQVLRGDWLFPVADGSLDAVVSNPPYIADADPHLGRGDLRFEPRAALAAGRQGLDAIRRLTAQATNVLRRGGLLLLEHGFDQGPSTRKLMHEHGFREIETRRDLAGLERCTAGFLFP
jgi:release factor glutamine methyltransferase